MSSTAVSPGPLFHCAAVRQPQSMPLTLPMTVLPAGNSPSIQHCLLGHHLEPSVVPDTEVNKAVHKCSATGPSAYCSALPNNRALWLSHKESEGPFEFPSCCQGAISLFIHSAISLHISSKKQLDMMILKVLVNLNNSLILRTPN